MGAFEAHPGTRESIVELLRTDHLVVLYPGGIREQIFGDDNYNLLWANRRGFAKVAIEAKAVRLD